MHRTLSTLVIVVQAVASTAYAVAGVFSFKHGHSYGGLLLFALAGWMLALIVWSVRSMSRLQHHRRAVRELEDQGMKLSNIDPETAQRMAVANLRHVAKLTGAKLLYKDSEAKIQIGKHSYHISDRYIRRHVRFKRWSAQSTCLTFKGHMPPAEMIAATLLLLKNNPSIFHRWRRRDDYYA